MGELQDGICQYLPADLNTDIVCCETCEHLKNKKTWPNVLETYTMFCIAVKERIFAVCQQSRKGFLQWGCKKVMQTVYEWPRDTTYCIILCLSEDLLELVCSQVVH